MESSPMSETRRKRQSGLAVEIVKEVADAVAGGLPADAILTRIFRRERGYGGRDRRCYAHAVFSYFRWRGWVEKWAPDQLERQVALAVTIDPESDDDARAMWADHAILDAGTAARLAMFDPATMADHGVSLDDLMPNWLPVVLPDEETRCSFIQTCARRPPAWLAVPVADVDSLRKLLEQQGIRFTVDLRIPGAIALHDRFHLETLEKMSGKVLQVQDIASQAVVLVCAPQPGEAWLDVCAGSGGKALGLARSVGPQGRVTAVDVRASILRNLDMRAAAHGFANVSSKNIDATLLQPEPVYDGVLVDAPCSGLGTWPRNPDARWRTAIADVKTSAEKQAALLAKAIQFVKPGGRLIYSICTLTPEEGVDLIGNFVADHPAWELRPFPHPLTGEKTTGYVRINPADGPGDGMFIAMLVKKPN